MPSVGNLLTFFWQFDPNVQKQYEIFTNLLKAGIAAVKFGAIANTTLAARVVLGDNGGGCNSCGN